MGLPVDQQSSAVGIRALTTFSRSRMLTFSIISVNFVEPAQHNSVIRFCFFPIYIEDT